MIAIIVLDKKANGYDVKIQLYTVPGQVKYNATRRLVLRGVDGVVFVADAMTVEGRVGDDQELTRGVRIRVVEPGGPAAIGRIETLPMEGFDAAIAADDEATSDLALAAARMALERSGIFGEDLDCVIVGTLTPSPIGNRFRSPICTW